MYAKLKQLYPSADFTKDIILQDDGAGVYIKHFDTAKLGTQPTQAAIDAVVIPTKTVLQLDIEKYQRRAEAKPLLMAEMAAMNVGRLKDGTWTTAQLVTLMADAQIKNIVSCMETLSFELAIQAIQACTNPLITADIKQAWITRLIAKL